MIEAIIATLHGGLPNIFAMTTEEINQLINTFKEKENCYNTLLSAIPDILFLMDIEGNYIKFQQGEGFVFIPTNKIVGSNIKDSGMPTEVVEKIMQQNAQAIATGTLSEITYALPSPYGVMHYYESRAVRYDDQKSLRIVRDTTQKVLAQQTINHQIVQLETAAKIAANELRKPIANILSLINIDNDFTVEEATETLKRIKMQVDLLEQKVAKINQTLQG